MPLLGQFSLSIFSLFSAYKERMARVQAKATHTIRHTSSLDCIYINPRLQMPLLCRWDVVTMNDGGFPELS